MQRGRDSNPRFRDNGIHINCELDYDKLKNEINKYWGKIGIIDLKLYDSEKNFPGVRLRPLGHLSIFVLKTH